MGVTKDLGLLGKSLIVNDLPRLVLVRDGHVEVLAVVIEDVYAHGPGKGRRHAGEQHRQVIAANNFISLSLASCGTSMRRRSGRRWHRSRDRSLKLPLAAIWRGAPLPVYLVVHPALAPAHSRVVVFVPSVQIAWFLARSSLHYALAPSALQE